MSHNFRPFDPSYTEANFSPKPTNVSLASSTKRGKKTKPEDTKAEKNKINNPMETKTQNEDDDSEIVNTYKRSHKKITNTQEEKDEHELKQLIRKASLEYANLGYNIVAIYKCTDDEEFIDPAPVNPRWKKQSKAENYKDLLKCLKDNVDINIALVSGPNNRDPEMGFGSMSIGVKNKDIHGFFDKINEEYSCGNWMIPNGYNRGNYYHFMFRCNYKIQSDNKSLDKRMKSCRKLINGYEVVIKVENELVYIPPSLLTDKTYYKIDPDSIMVRVLPDYVIDMINRKNDKTEYLETIDDDQEEVAENNTVNENSGKSNDIDISSIVIPIIDPDLLANIKIVEVSLIQTKNPNTSINDFCAEINSGKIMIKNYRSCQLEDGRWLFINLRKSEYAVPRKVMYNIYKTWCQYYGKTIFTNSEFYMIVENMKLLSKRYIQKERYPRSWCYILPTRYSNNYI